MSINSLKSVMQMSANMASDFNQINEERFYLEAGRAFSTEPLPDDEIEQIAKKIASTGWSFKPGECYMNAGRVALETDLIFCEGYAMGMWPVAHGWLTYKDRAIDVTWPTEWKSPTCFRAVRTVELLAERIKFNVVNCFYWGIEVPTEIARHHFLKHMRWSPLFDQRNINKWVIAGLNLQQMKKLFDAHPSKNAMMTSRRRK